jgi:hypothetical protein
MYNPFPLFTPTLLLAQISEAKGKRFFVRQTFQRGKQPELKAAFLFRGYTEEEKELAQEHVENLSRDPHAFLYDAKNEAHLEKLKTAARQPSGFKIYYVGKTKWEWKPPPVYQVKMKNYIQKLHPRWRTARGKNKVMVGLYEECGELFLKFNFEEEEDKIVFDAIENF